MYLDLKEILIGRFHHDKDLSKDINDRDQVQGEPEGKCNMYIDRLWVLEAFLDMVGCALSVVRHEKSIRSMDDVFIHPMAEIVGGKDEDGVSAGAAKLLDSTSRMISWIQAVIFDNTREYHKLSSKEYCDDCIYHPETGSKKDSENGQDNTIGG
ncbi:MAG: hypothetical protein E3K32_13350 [wastewater metagenome]|nr:hypothetical protein [Candidatus Loosdrechtia aerotolerans]